MANGRNLSASQSKIVKRYYDNIDTAMIQKLGEMVSDLYLADSPAKQKALWDRVVKALNNTDADPDYWQRFVKSRSIEKLALFLGDLNLGKYPRKPKPEDRPKPMAAPTPAPGSAPGSAAGSSAAATSDTANPALASGASGASGEPVAPEFEAPYLRHAMNQFKKRIKLNKLDAESRIGRSPLTSGRGSGIVAITPPQEFPHAVWEHLAKQGRLKKSGSNMYHMP